MNLQGGLAGAGAGSSLGPWGAVAGGVMGLFGGDSGSDAAAQASAQNIAYQKEHNAQVDPISTSGARAGYAADLNTMVKGGASTMFNDPVFQHMQQQSMEATQRKMSSQGQGIGTNDTLALQGAAFGQANSFFSQQYDRLATLANAGGGGGQTPQGQSPGSAGTFAAQGDANRTSNVAGIAGGLSKIFGQPDQQQPTTQTVDPRTTDGFSWGAT